jgi:hypothetical protein
LSCIGIPVNSATYSTTNRPPNPEHSGHPRRGRKTGMDGEYIIQLKMVNYYWPFLGYKSSISAFVDIMLSSNIKANTPITTPHVFWIIYYPLSAQMRRIA